MALQSSGAISLSDIAGEFGGSTPHSLSEYYGVAAGVPSSGTIDFADFYGASAAFDVDYLVVAGGGGGGGAKSGYIGGGGGGGQVLTATLTGVTSPQQYNITVGAGGGAGGMGGHTQIGTPFQNYQAALPGGQGGGNNNGNGNPQSGGGGPRPFGSSTAGSAHFSGSATG